MDKKQSLILKKYLDLAFRRKIILCILLLISLPVGLGVYLVIPKVYESSTMLSFQQQKISTGKMTREAMTKLHDTVSTLAQIITSRTNLETVIKRFDLYPQQREEMPLEDVIEGMRRHIEIEPSSKGDTFRIAFRGSDPQKVAKVANALAAKFIEENLKYREERASETSSYTSNELARAKVMMDEKEATMRDYKLKYYNEMPEQRESNVARLIALQTQLQAKQENILELERTRVMIQEQIAIRKKILSAEEEASRRQLQGDAADQVDDKVETAEEYLQRLQNNLDNLLVKYTENHPEVRRIKKLIKKAELDAANQKSAGSGITSNSKQMARVDKDILQFQTQVRNIKIAIDSITRERKELSTRLEQYDVWVSAAPVREAEWSALTREYGELKRHYDYLVAQDLKAKSLLNLERKQKGSQFKVEDPARLPVKPVKPDFFKIMVVALMVFMGGGAGLILLLDFFDSSFRDPDEIEMALGIEVVSTVAFINTEKEKKRNLIKSGIILLILLLCFIAVGLLFYNAWRKGLIVV